MPAKRVPDNVKALRGTDKPCKEFGPSLDFEAVEDLPAAPQYLDVRAKAYWDRITPVLFEKRVLSVADLEALEVLCILYGKVRQAVEAGVDVNAATVTQLRLYQTEFGMTPVSRQKIRAGDDGSKGNKFTGNGKKKT